MTTRGKTRFSLAQDEIEELEAERDRYKKALEEYADESNWENGMGFMDSWVCEKRKEGGEPGYLLAQQVLKGQG